MYYVLLQCRRRLAKAKLQRQKQSAPSLYSKASISKENSENNGRKERAVNSDTPPAIPLKTRITKSLAHFSGIRFGDYYNDFCFLIDSV